MDQIVKKSYRDYDEEARQLYALKLKSFMDELAQTERKSSHARSFLLRMIEEIELITTLVSCPAMEDAQASCWGPGGHFDADAASSLIIPPSGSKRLNH